MSYESKLQAVSISLTALFMASVTGSCSSHPGAVVASPNPVVAAPKETAPADASKSASTASPIAATPPARIPKKLPPEQPFAFAARFNEPVNLGFAGGRVFAMLREEIPNKASEEYSRPAYWAYVFELRGNKFQSVFKRKFKGDLIFAYIVAKDGKPYLGGYNPESRAGVTEFEPIDPKDKRISGGADEVETPVPPECENPAAATSKILPMRDLYWYMRHEGTLFYKGTSCDGKPNLQIVQNGQATMTPVQHSDQLVRTDLGLLLATATASSVYEKNAFVPLSHVLPEIPRDMMRAPDGTILALGLGKDNFALRKDGWTQWLLEDARSEFTIVSDGSTLWAYVDAPDVTELYRYTPAGTKRGEPIDVSAVKLPTKKP